MRFHSAMATLQPQKYVPAGTVGTENILLVSGRLFKFKNNSYIEKGINSFKWCTLRKHIRSLPDFPREKMYFVVTPIVVILLSLQYPVVALRVSCISAAVSLRSTVSSAFRRANSLKHTFGSRRSLFHSYLAAH